ncbi:putative nuclease HARBI1 [Heptranchias perlo]|uniref:putative nuclease HARBI1 n=1 Tax=Heptranchias perlo TaxID=212740 RepID=UPI00355A9DAD
MSKDQCIQWLWFTKEVVTDICQLLQPQLQPQSRAATAFPVAVKVIMALNFYSSGSFQASAGDICNISQFAVHCCIREVTEALYKLRKRFITLPFDREKQNERAQGFAHIAGFPRVQGAIDCMHIAMRAPHLNSALFMIRNGFHSLSVQLACDHTQRIMQVNARYSGSSHDAFIMQQSNVLTIFAPARQVKGWLLGDKSNPLMRWLMTLVRHVRTHAEQAYNESHAVTHRRTHRRPPKATLLLPGQFWWSPAVLC